MAVIYNVIIPAFLQLHSYGRKKREKYHYREKSVARVFLYADHYVLNQNIYMLWKQVNWAKKYLKLLILYADILVICSNL